MTAFFVGFALGAAFTACMGIILFLQREPRRREPAEWVEDFHEPIAVQPPVKTIVLVQQRRIEL